MRSFIDGHLANHPWFAGEQLSMADIQMSFPLFALLARGGIAHLDPYQRMESAGRNASSLAASDSAGRSVYHSRRIMAFL